MEANDLAQIEISQILHDIAYGFSSTWLSSFHAAIEAS